MPLELQFNVKPGAFIKEIFTNVYIQKHCPKKKNKSTVFKEIQSPLCNIH